jgi:hypothetical protein
VVLVRERCARKVRTASSKMTRFAGAEWPGSRSQGRRIRRNLPARILAEHSVRKTAGDLIDWLVSFPFQKKRNALAHLRACTISSQNCDNLRVELVENKSPMETALVFPYFLARFLARMGLCDFAAELVAVLLSSICLVSVVCAPFHPMIRVKLTMAGIAWLVVVLAAVGCVWECEDSKRRQIRSREDHAHIARHRAAERLEQQWTATEPHNPRSLNALDARLS